MPFGEYMPFSDYFPWLLELNPNVGGFKAGAEAEVFQFPQLNQGASLGVAPLICYEDVIPGPGAEATRAGAEVLVNLTNDAWFGDSIAPNQHHLIASFRAIENRRYLLRSTNTGLTAIVDPFGKTIGQVPKFSEDILSSKVHALQTLSFYTQFPVEQAWRGLSGALLLIILGRVFARRFRNTGSAQ